MSSYDVYYTTGGGPWVNAGTDMWVNEWIKYVYPKLETKSVLCIHRNKPNNWNDVEYEFPMEVHWHGDDIPKFENIVNNSRRIHILHGHYTPTKPIIQNKDKIFSHIIHNSVDHILKSGIGTDVPVLWHPMMSSEWESDVVKWSENNIWVGLFDTIHHSTNNIQNIPNYYKFNYNKDLSKSLKVGFTARPESRKNPHFLDGHTGYMFSESSSIRYVWESEFKIDLSDIKVYHFHPDFKEKFYSKNWGISHSAFTYEPFGYSIFESVDHGKLPILHGTWLPDFKYPYRASSKIEFDNTYNKICNTPYDERNKHFQELKTYLQSNFGSREKWVNELLRIYNGN